MDEKYLKALDEISNIFLRETRYLEKPPTEEQKMFLSLEKEFWEILNKYGIELP